jgi:hypothetical protein
LAAGAAFFAVAITISLIKLQRAPRRSIQRGDSPTSCRQRVRSRGGVGWAWRMEKQDRAPPVGMRHQRLQ